MIYTLLVESSESSVQHFKQSDTNSATISLIVDTFGYTNAGNHNDEYAHQEAKDLNIYVKCVMAKHKFLRSTTT